MSNWSDKLASWKEKRARFLKENREGMSCLELANREGVRERTMAVLLAKAKRDEKQAAQA